MSHPVRALRSGIDDKVNAACRQHENVVFRKYICEVSI
jgi:hypothetical protein